MVLRQNWIVTGDIQLLSVHVRPADRVPLGTAVLLAGFSHPMCDMDYFMSRLARQLAAQGIFAAQVDLRGHGDSGGKFSSVDLETLREDIRLVLNYCCRLSPDRLICVGRGLTATLLAELATEENVAGVAGISPYCIDPRMVQKHCTGIDEAATDAAKIFPGNDYVVWSDFSDAALNLLNALGAVPYNIHGLEASGRLIRQLSEFDARTALRPKKGQPRLWLFPDGSARRRPMALDLAEDGYPDADLYRPESLPRNPVYQREALAMLVEWAVSTCQLN